MARLNLLIAAIFTTLLLTSGVMAQEDSKNEVSVQGTVFFTNDTTGNGLTQRTTNSGGLLVSYRHHLTRLLSADGSYGYTRNTFQNLTSAGASNIQSNAHQVTGALVLNSPWKLSLLKPFALAGTGVLNFDPTGNPGGLVAGASGQNKGVFLYGAGADIDLNSRFAFRLEYRGLVYDRPDFGIAALNSGRTTHTAQPSAGFLVRF
ncbi:MAG TPA: outer membrane beta-barrel protein [Blastocatellia bacterium]|nr:outer membrane beta-barrel protein [Blastocatellia bacterium]